MSRFAFVKKYAAAGLPLPRRGTADSAGYDLATVEDVIVPSHIQKIRNCSSTMVLDIEEAQRDIKTLGLKPVLISTGLKCYLDEGTYLQLVPRSSLPLKNLLLVANSPGIIDRDYADNEGNEGEIYIQILNLSPFDIKIPKGTRLAQGIITPFKVIDDDAASGVRAGGFGHTGV